MDEDLRTVILPEDDGRRVDAVLKDRLSFSGTMIRLCRDGFVLLDGLRVNMNERLHTGQVLTVSFPPEEASDISPSAGKLDIIFENAALLAIDKPAGLAVHPTRRYQDDTLAGRLLYHRPEVRVFRALNRLDRGVSGIVIAAKNRYYSALLTDRMTGGRISKTYLALLDGCLSRPEGEIDLPIARKEGSALMRSVSPEGQRAVTRYKVLFSDGMQTLVMAEPVTGRTHQLRVHFSHLGCPIHGDFMYGREEDGLRLRCIGMELQDPVTGDPLRISAALPEWAEKYTANGDLNICW